MRFRPFLLPLGLVLVLLLALNAQEHQTVLPRVIDHAAVIYPAIARTANVQGSVRLKITTDGQAVSRVVVIDGPPLLAESAAENAKTWKFVDHTPGTFDVTFNFRILENQTAFLAEPGVVDIAVLHSGHDGNTNSHLEYTSPATWDLELRTANDIIEAPLTLWTYGPWLRGYTIEDSNRERQIANPHVEGNMLGFDALLDDSSGQRLRFSVIGRKSGGKIQGLFLDAWGKSGPWTAVPSIPPHANCPAPSSAAQENIIPVPEVAQHTHASFPLLALEAQIQGQVRMRVTADTYCAAKITTESGDPLLAQAAEDNVRTWQFAYHKPGTFNLTFNYLILGPQVSFLAKPGIVEISALPPTLAGPESGLWNSGGFEGEIWKAKLTSRSGRTSATFQFVYGCCEEGKTTDAKGDSEEITQGFRSDHNVGFSTIVRLANGRPTKVSLIGRLQGYDKIQGVFLDEFGTPGTWSARMVSHGHGNTYE